MTEKQEQNLRLFGRDRSQSEARELGRKGGIASGKARREKRAFKEAIKQQILAYKEIVAGLSSKQLVKVANEFKRKGVEQESLELEKNNSGFIK